MPYAEIIGAVLVAVITGACSVIGVSISTKKQHTETQTELKNDIKVINFELKQEIALIKKGINNLEDKQDKHNGLIERMYAVEKSTGILEEKQTVANHRIDDLEDAIKK